MLETVFERMDTGMIALDYRDNIVKINNVGRSLLNLSHLPKGAVAFEQTKNSILDMPGYKLTTSAGVFWLYCRVFELDMQQYRRVILFSAVEDQAKLEEIPQKTKKNTGVGRLLGRSPQMAEHQSRIRNTASSLSNILICGEGGTEKATTALAIHEEGERAQEPFVSYLCAPALDRQMELELFGSAEGGTAKRRGKFEEAGKGTLYIEDVTNMSQAMQIKLLKVLETKNFARVGSTKQIKLSCRMIFSAPDDLQQKIQDGSLRRDLYYRMNVIPLRISPLRERGTDKVLLALTYLKLSSKQMKREILSISKPFEQAVMTYDWPGNVWELQNAMEYTANMIPKSGAVDAEHLPYHIRTAIPADHSPSYNLERIEKESIANAIAVFGDDKQALADNLGIGIATLYRKLKRYSL